MSDFQIDRSNRFAQLVGLELKGEFAKHNISQTKVADHLGHSRGGYSKWINAKPSMPLETFLNTCEFIGVDPRTIVDAAYSRLIDELGPITQEDRSTIGNGLSDEERIAVAKREYAEKPWELAALHDPNKKIEMMGDAGPDWDDPA